MNGYQKLNLKAAKRFKALKSGLIPVVFTYQWITQKGLNKLGKPKVKL